MHSEITKMQFMAYYIFPYKKQFPSNKNIHVGICSENEACIHDWFAMTSFICHNDLLGVFGAQV